MTAGPLALAVVMCGLAGRSAAAQVALVEEGRTVFTRNCAICHGDSGNGYGPASWVLVRRPADLTTMTTRSTPFPTERVRNIITGRIRLQPSHGSSEMPYWHRLDTEIDGGRGLTEMDALLAFLEYLQIRPYRALPGLSAEEKEAVGATLFSRWCADCHRAPQAAAAGYVVGVSAPDLTTMQSRYAGQMDAARIFERIARQHAGSTSEMPSAYDTLIQRGWTRVGAQRDLEAIAAYVASIQARRP